MQRGHVVTSRRPIRSRGVHRKWWEFGAYLCLHSSHFSRVRDRSKWEHWANVKWKGASECPCVTLCKSFGTKTEFISTVQGQCATGAFTQAVGASSLLFGGESSGILAPGHGVVATTIATTNMNQLGTVYATKRRRRNGKRLVFWAKCLNAPSRNQFSSMMWSMCSLSDYPPNSRY